MSSFSPPTFEKKLADMTMSQQSIQTLALWCIHHRKHARAICPLWFKALQRAKPKRKLVIIYLANDILQNCRRKGPEYANEFQPILSSAFHHTAKACDGKVVESLKRILNIWLERNVYDNVFVGKLKKSLALKRDRRAAESPPQQDTGATAGGGGSGVAWGPVTPPLEKKSKLEDLRRPKHPPDPDELVTRLQELENSATQDAVVRERIANLPTEVTDPTYIDRVTDIASARKLSEKINIACELLGEYNARLAEEQVDRARAQKMLLDYIALQKYQQALIESRHEEHRTKLEQVTSVREELKSHLNNLPDLSKLPEPVPLPSAGDLFGTPIKGAR